MSINFADILGDRRRLSYWRWCRRKPRAKHCPYCGSPAIAWWDHEEGQWIEIGCHVASCP